MPNPEIFLSNIWESSQNTISHTGINRLEFSYAAVFIKHKNCYYRSFLCLYVQACVGKVGYWRLESRKAQSTSSTFFFQMLIWDRISPTCPGWPQTYDPRSLASQVVRITGVCHHPHPVRTCLQLGIYCSLVEQLPGMRQVLGLIPITEQEGSLVEDDHLYVLATL